MRTRKYAPSAASPSGSFLLGPPGRTALVAMAFLRRAFPYASRTSTVSMASSPCFSTLCVGTNGQDGVSRERAVVVQSRTALAGRVRRDAFRAGLRAGRTDAQLLDCKGKVLARLCVLSSGCRCIPISDELVNALAGLGGLVDGLLGRHGGLLDHLRGLGEVAFGGGARGGGGQYIVRRHISY